MAHHQCGLCGQYGHRYRSRTRWLAGDDPSLLVMLIESLLDEPAPRVRVRCPIPFVPARPAIDPDWPPLRAVAAVQLFLAGEKLFDDRLDREGLLSATAERLLRRDIRRAEAELTEMGFPLDVVRATLRRQRMVEADTTADLDDLAAPTAAGLRRLVTWCGEVAGCRAPGVLADFAADLGRALYLVDAIDDLPSDERRAQFNPLRHAVGPLTRSGIAFVEAVLIGWIEALDGSFRKLPLVRNAGVLRRATVDSLRERGTAALARLRNARPTLRRLAAPC